MEFIRQDGQLLEAPLPFRLRDVFFEQVSGLTTYQVLKRGEYAALVQAQIHTGRTHQIRIHFRHIGYPLVGDATYGERQNARLREQTRYAPKRQMLHAWKMAFTHPTTQERMHIQAPPPEDFLQSVRTLIGEYEGF